MASWKLEFRLVPFWNLKVPARSLIFLPLARQTGIKVPEICEFQGKYC